MSRLCLGASQEGTDIKIHPILVDFEDHFITKIVFKIDQNRVDFYVYTLLRGSQTPPRHLKTLFLNVSESVELVLKKSCQKSRSRKNVRTIFFKIAIVFFSSRDVTGPPPTYSETLSWNVKDFKDFCFFLGQL